MAQPDHLKPSGIKGTNGSDGRPNNHSALTSINSPLAGA